MYEVDFLLSIHVLAAFTLIAASCSLSTDELVEPSLPSEEKYIEVPIGFSGEITNVTESPLSRAADVKDWYAFQVYAMPENASSGYRPYAYGFFDNKENMIIKLKTGYKYKFDVNMVVDGSKRVYHFSLCNAGWTKIENSFFISSEESVRYMYEGYLYLSTPYDTFDRPNVDRFFGRTEGYVPTEKETVQINMKRVSFGAKFVAQKFTEGGIEIKVEGAPLIKLDLADGNEVQDIISFENLEKAYSSTAEYIENIPVNIIWVRPDQVRVPVAAESIAFKRNKLKTIEFELKDDPLDNGFELGADGVMEMDGTIQIGGEGSNTGVNPTN